MKIYMTTEDYFGSYYTRYWRDKENAEKYIAENDEPWTNDNGVTFHTIHLQEYVIETED